MKKTIIIMLVSLFMALSSHADSTLNGSVTFPNNWEKIKLKGLNLNRLKLPGGWLVREGLGKFAGLALDGQERKMIFVPDADFKWQELKDKNWETLKLKGLNLYRLKLPEGWLVREGYGKIGSENQSLGFLYIDDTLHAWDMKF